LFTNSDPTLQDTFTLKMPLHFSLPKIIQGDTAQLDQLFQAVAPLATTDLRHNTAEKLCSVLLYGEKPKNNSTATEQFDPALAPQLHALQQSLNQQIAQDSAFYCEPQHPLRTALNVLLLRGRTWYHRESKTSQQFLEKLSAFMLAFNHGALTTLACSHTEFQQWLDAEDKRASMLESRLCETEVNHFKTLSAECRVLDFMNGALAGRPFPHDLHSSLIAVLKSELLHAYFIAGENSPFWKMWQRLLPSLSKTFATIARKDRDEDDEQTLYRTIPALLNELERSLNINTSNPDSYRQWTEILSEQLMLAIKKQSIDCSIFTALSYPEGHSSLNTRVTADLLQQTNRLQEGDWILFSGENTQTIRCKLALKNSETGQLLFVDHNGRKVMNKSIKDFAVCLSTGIAKKMQPVSIEESITHAIQELIDAHAHQQNQHQAQLEVKNKQALAALELQHQQEIERKAAANAAEKKRIVQQLDARRAAAQKALAEAATLAKQRAERAAELKIAQERERMQAEAEQAAGNLQRMQLANIHISALNLGARVELLQNGEPLLCKLAVIIAATGKYIFTDNLGRKVAEFQREQLVQALIDKQLTLLNNGDSFDDQLVKVIRGLRKDIS
jgi:hypothetical protein